MKTLFVFDIDATCADARWRNTIAGPEPDRNDRRKYLKWLKKVQSRKMLMKDKPVKGMKELVKAVQGNAIYLTSRSEAFRDVTDKWLRKQKFPKLKLYMRGKGDWKSSGKFKEALILSLVKNRKMNVIVFDDDPKGDIFQECQRNGWTMLKALSG